MKLGLGTVQFGLDYGISNKKGQTSQDQVKEILLLAELSNTTLLDTSCAYGNSESIIGNYSNHNKFDIVTKTPVFNRNIIKQIDANELTRSFNNSLSNLQINQVYGLLTHGPEDLLKPGGSYLFNAMKTLKSEGKVNKIGSSVYNQKQIEDLVNIFDIDLIQLPFNILDQRFLHDGTFDFLKQNNIEIHVRSAFLQGLLFIPLSQLPEFFQPIKPTLIRLKHKLSSLNLSPAQAALAFINQTPQIDRIICGVNTAEQLQELTKAINTTIDHEDFYQFAINELKFIDPSQWP